MNIYRQCEIEHEDINVHPQGMWGSYPTTKAARYITSNTLIKNIPQIGLFGLCKATLHQKETSINLLNSDIFNMTCHEVVASYT